MIFLSKLYKLAIISISLGLSSTQLLVSQNNVFESVHSVYDDSAREWLMYSYDSLDNFESHMTIKWPFRNDWTEWTVDHRNAYYHIRMRSSRNPVQWEITGDNYRVSIRQKWLNDPSQWVLSYSNKHLMWRTEYPSDLEYWFFELSENNFFEMWTEIQGDLRDWAINDKAANVPDEVKIAAIFITVYLTSPKQ